MAIGPLFLKGRQKNDRVSLRLVHSEACIGISPVDDDVEGAVGTGSAAVLPLWSGDHQNVVRLLGTAARQKNASLHGTAHVGQRIEAYDSRVNLAARDANAVFTTEDFEDRDVSAVMVNRAVRLDVRVRERGPLRADASSLAPVNWRLCGVAGGDCGVDNAHVTVHGVETGMYHAAGIGDGCVGAERRQADQDREG
jgi:hypothetical protein